LVAIAVNRLLAELNKARVFVFRQGLDDLRECARLDVRSDSCDEDGAVGNTRPER
jgi:hypothetical protein